MKSVSEIGQVASKLVDHMKIEIDHYFPYDEVSEVELHVIVTHPVMATSGAEGIALLNLDYKMLQTDAKTALEDLLLDLGCPADFALKHGLTKLQEKADTSSDGEDHSVKNIAMEDDDDDDDDDDDIWALAVMGNEKGCSQEKEASVSQDPAAKNFDQFVKDEVEEFFWAKNWDNYLATQFEYQCTNESKSEWEKLSPSKKG